jgi:HK97 family phage major capsid protein
MPYKPNDGMKVEAQRGLDWREEHGRGGTRIGAVRARQIVAGENLSEDTVKRMYSFHSRHQVDKQGEGYNVGEKGYPSNGRIAIALWGGDAGYAWSKRIVERLKKEDERQVSDSFESEKHPVEITEEKTMLKEDRHILSVSETDDSVIVEFEKHNEDVEQLDQEEDRDLDAEMVYRSVDLSRASYLDEEKRRVRIGVSSEEPVERNFGMEVLSHSEGDVDMEFIASGRAPLLLDHDMTKQIGVIEEYKLDAAKKRAVAIVRFGRSQLADEVFQDVKDGIRQNISVGYRINGMERDRSSEDDKPVYRVTHSPLEISVVSVPADQSKEVGIGRSKEKQLQTKKVKIMTEEVKNEINLDEVRAKSVEEAKAEFKRNSKEILDLAAKHNKRDLADKAIQEGISVEEFRGVLLENISNDKPLETPEIGMTNNEIKRFSLVKAIRALANPSDRRAQEDAKFEFECSEAAQREYGKDAQGIMLPADVLRNWKRDLNTSDDSTLISEDYRGGDFIDVLRNASSVMQAGATMLRGLQGNVVIPKKTASSSAGWIATEGGAASESEFTSGSVTMSPKVIGAFTDASRLMLQQSSLDVENLIRDDLSQSIALAIDLGALAGSGSSGQPTGISNTSGINTTTFAAANPTFAEIVGMESAVSNDNALLGNLAYICRPADYGTLKTTAKDSGSGLFVVEPDGRMNGYNTVVSNQVTSGDFYFGNFSDLLVGMYGGLDITVDPYALSTSGGIRIVALQTVDVAVRHAVSFCVSNDGA